MPDNKENRGMRHPDALLLVGTKDQPSAQLIFQVMKDVIHQIDHQFRPSGPNCTNRCVFCPTAANRIQSLFLREIY